MHSCSISSGRNRPHLDGLLLCNGFQADSSDCSRRAFQRKNEQPIEECLKELGTIGIGVPYANASRVRVQVLILLSFQVCDRSILGHLRSDLRRGKFP